MIASPPAAGTAPPPVLGDTLRPYVLALARHPRRPAVARISRYLRRRMSRGELLAASRQVADWLHRAGVASGEAVVLQAPGGPEWTAGFFGCVLHGAVAVPVDVHWSPAEVAAAAVRVQARAYLLDTSAREPDSIDTDHGSGEPPPAGLPRLDLGRLDDAIAPPGHAGGAADGDPDDPASRVEIVFTSGTTGRPRAVPITHRNILAGLHPIERGWRKRRRWVDRLRPRVLCAVPPDHLFGQVVGILIPLLMGLPVTFIDDLRPRAVRDVLRHEGITAAIVVPRLLKLLQDDVTRAGLAPSALPAVDAAWWRRAWTARRLHRALGRRFVAWISGGAALDEKVDDFWHRCGYVVVQGYGLTESAPIIAVSHPFKRRPGSVGRPLPGQEIRVGAGGELWVRGDNVAAGYLDDDDATATVFQDGWLRTGDRVTQDAHGALAVRGRLKDVIVTGDGVNVDPAVVEKELERQPGVREAAVVARAGGSGDTVHTELVMDRGARPQAAVAAANGRLPPGQRVQSFGVWPAPTLPRTSSGKLQRVRVRDGVARRLQAGDSSPSAALSTLVVSDPVRAAVAAMTGRTETGLEPAVDLDRDLGLGSLDRMELLVRLEEATGRTLDETAVAAARTLEDLAAAAATPPATPLSMPRWSRRAAARAARGLGRRLVVAPAFHALFRLQVSGREHVAAARPPFLLVANHESHLDTAAILLALPPGRRGALAVAMATEHLPAVFGHGGRSGPRAWGQHLAYLAAVLLFHAYPLPRHGGFSVTLDYTAELLDAGFCPLIYPEGRMRRGGEPAPPFRDGPAVLARNLQVPVVPVGLVGAGVALAPGSRRPRCGRLSVCFGPALHVAGDETGAIDRFTRRLEKAVRSLADAAAPPVHVPRSR